MAPLGTALLTLGLALLAFVDSRDSSASIVFYGALVVCVVGFSYVTPALQSLLSLTTPAERQGVVLGLGQSANALARIAGPLVGIWLIRKSVPLAYGVSAIIMLVGFAFLFPLLGMLRRQFPERSARTESPSETPTPAMID